MVKHNSYIPTDKRKFKDWGLDFARTAKDNIGKFGLTDAVCVDLKKLADDMVNNSISEKALIDAKQVQVQKSRDDRQKAETAFRERAQIIKADPNYNIQVGKDFDIIGDEVQKDVPNSKPTLIAKKAAYGWEFKFGLENYFDGVNIYRKKPDQDKFRFLATDTRSPYVDTSDIEDGTQYYAYFILGDTMVGQESDIVTVKV